MNNRILVFIVLVSFCIPLSAQNAYWVFFKDKKDCTFNPYEYFDKKAIERRVLHGIELYDSTDFPVNSSYVQQCEALSDSTIGITRWLNGIAVHTQDISSIAALDFVRAIRPIDGDLSPCKKKDYQISYVNQTMKLQTEVLGAKHFNKAEIDGTGIRIAIFDIGFPDVNIGSAFEHIRKENRIIKTYDFPKKSEDVYHGNAHGTMVMSVIGGMYGDHALGLATGAEFLLARTEINIEIKKEEVWWLMAAEWADKNGAQIINSSLGYTYQRYFRSDMDGKHSIVGKAANMAAAKGILVVNAAGNDGDNKWKVIGTPADVDSVLSIGGVKPYYNYGIGFSSYGPTADGRMKPNVCGYGQAFVETEGGKRMIVSGTSFASPLIAGFAACAMQANPNLTNMQLFKLIERSGSLYPYFDYKHGYGIPQARKVLFETEELHEFTFRFDQQKDAMYLDLYPRRTNHPTPNLVYFNVTRDSEILYYYAVLEVESNRVKLFGLGDNNNSKYTPMDGDVIKVHYQGHLDSITINLKEEAE